MLIHLHASCAADVVSGSASSARSRSAVENLLVAHFDGNHVVSIAPSEAQTLRDAAPWSARARRALEHIDESYPQIAGLREDLPWSIEVGLGADFDGSAQPISGARRIVRASLAAFERYATTVRSSMLGENATDADLFVELALSMLAARRWDALQITFDARGGGGRTIGVEFARLAENGQIILAVADTDVRHPGGREGDTYLALRQSAAGRPEYQRARPLPARTAEGLVPLSFYRDAFTELHGDGDVRIGSVQRLEPFFRSAPRDIARYAHLKDGVRLYQIENPRSESEGQYWEGIARDVGRDRCVLPSQSRCTRREACSCHVVDALGGGALTDVVSWMRRRKSKRALAKRFGFEENAPLAELADEVLAWGLAMPPLMT